MTIDSGTIPISPTVGICGTCEHVRFAIILIPSTGHKICTACLREIGEEIGMYQLQDLAECELPKGIFANLF